MRQTLVQDLSKGEGSKIKQEMDKEKEAFIKRHAIKKSAQDAISNVELKQNQTVVSLPRKRVASDDDELESVENLEKKLSTLGKK